MTTTILARKFMVPLAVSAVAVFLGAFFIFIERVQAPVVQQGGTLHQTKTTTTTLFWVGEGMSAENDYISNAPSYWDEQWQAHFGGIDDPYTRCDFLPCSFVPLENPFYVALPYAEYDTNGVLKESAKNIPWYASMISAGEPLLKNHWVVVTYRSKTCYGQWEDVGPNGEDDFAYVFGTSTIPGNTFGEKAGLDISPALFTCLGMDDNALTSWRFVDADEVPEGPWLTTVTKSGLNWQQ